MTAGTTPAMQATGPRALSGARSGYGENEAIARR